MHVAEKELPHEMVKIAKKKVRNFIKIANLLLIVTILTAVSEVQAHSVICLCYSRIFMSRRRY